MSEEFKGNFKFLLEKTRPGPVRGRGRVHKKLIDKWNEAEGDAFAVFIPIFTIFESASSLLSVRAVDEEQEKESQVEIRQIIVKECRDAPDESR